jgi:hypothetical protein
MFDKDGLVVARRDIAEHETIHFATPAVSVALHASQTLFRDSCPRERDGELCAVFAMSPLVGAFYRTAMFPLFAKMTWGGAPTPHALPRPLMEGFEIISVKLSGDEATRFVTVEFLTELHFFFQCTAFVATLPGAPLLAVEAAFFPDMVSRMPYSPDFNVSCFYSSSGLRVCANHTIRRGALLMTSQHETGWPGRDLKVGPLCQDADRRGPFLQPGKAWSEMFQIKQVLNFIDDAMPQIRQDRSLLLHAFYLLSRAAHALPFRPLAPKVRARIADTVLHLGCDRTIESRASTDLLHALVIARMVTAGIKFRDREYLCLLYEKFEAMVPELMHDVSEMWSTQVEHYYSAAVKFRDANAENKALCVKDQ